MLRTGLEHGQCEDSTLFVTAHCTQASTSGLSESEVLLHGVQVPYSIGGSGSAYITGFCDKFFKAGMTRQECIEFCRRAVSHAMFRDGSSGGCIRLVIVDKDGVQEDFMPGNLVPVHGEERNLPVWSGFPEPAAAMTS